jgi:hypothetical protein
MGNEANDRRIFIDANDTRRFILDLADGSGVFVPTRLGFVLGDKFRLAIRAHRVSRPIELPVTVVGRRAPKGASGLLSTGVLVKLDDRDDPTGKLLLDIASGTVVDFEGRLRERLRIPVEAVFDDWPCLRAELRQMLDGEPGLFPGVSDVAAGDRLLATLSTRDGALFGTLPVEVRGLVIHSPTRGCTVRFFDRIGPAEAESLIIVADRGVDKSLVRQSR